MSSSLFVDTGYIIALINQNDQHHQQAMQLSAKYEGYAIVTTDAVLLEIGNALSRIARQEAITIIRYFQTTPEATVVSLAPVLLTSVIQMYETHQDKTWGLVDCLSFVVMKQHQISVVLSFDRHFIQAGFALAK